MKTDRQYLMNRYYNMIRRCYDVKAINYKDYGMRGITICDEWLNNKESFITWALSNGYSQELEIDRIDNNLGYSPSNCHFVTHQINMLNKRVYKIPKNNKTGHKNIHWNKDCKKYRLYIRVNNKRVHGGYFESIEEALFVQKNHLKKM